MGWQDAPLAKPSSGKAKWESAPLAAPAKGSLRTPGVAAAYRELEQRYPEKQKLPFGLPRPSAMSERMVESATLGGYGAGVRNLARGRVALQRKLPGGEKMPYTADEYYEASRLFDANRRETFAKEQPSAAFASDIVGGALTPGAEAIGAFVTGAKAARLAAEGRKVSKLVRAGQATRLSAVGGTFGATQGALQSRSGEAATQAKQQGLAGAVLAPVVGAAIPAGVKVAESAADIASRIVKPRTATQLASEKLAALLQRARVAPADINAALNHYTSTGLIEPSVYDVLRKAGAGPDVLRFFQVSGSYPNVRAAAATQAAETTKALQPKALAATRKLPTSGETRTPSQIREEQALEAARVKQETEQAMADATRTTEQATAGVAPAPTGPARGSGAKELFNNLNALYDTKVKAYTEAFTNARKAKPESAIIADEQRTPLRTTLYQAMSPFLNPDLKSTSTVAKLADDLVDGIVPADAAGEFSKNARPLTVAELFGKRTALVELANNFTKSGDNQAAAAANAAKSALDAELTRLSAEGHIQGDPKVVDLWNQGLQGFSQTQEVFGKGLAKDLVERIPGKPDQNVIKPYQAGDVIFGKGENVRNLNDLHADLETISTVVPDAVTAVQRELYTRVKPENLPKAQERFNEVFGDLMPRDLSDAAIAAQQRAAQVEAQNAQLLANTEAQNAQRLASAEAQQARLTGAVGLGESLRSMPSEEFTRAVTNVPQDLRPLVQAGGRQQLINMLEKPEPGSTNLFGQLQSERSTQNLGALYGDEGAKFQQTLEGLGTQARNTQELAQAVEGETPSDVTMIEQPVDLVRPRWIAARATLAKLRGKTRLSPEESMELYNLMRSQGAQDLNTLEGLARIKTVGPMPSLSVPVSRAFTNRSKEKTLDDLSTEYDLGY